MTSHTSLYFFNRSLRFRSLLLEPQFSSFPPFDGHVLRQLGHTGYIEIVNPCHLQGHGYVDEAKNRKCGQLSGSKGEPSFDVRC